MAGDILMSSNVLPMLEKMKSENLREVLSYVKRESPLYIRKFANIDSDSIEGIKDVHKLPFTTRQDLVDEAPFGTLCRSAVPEAYYESSGTSGTYVPGFPDLSAKKAESFGQFLDQWMGLRKNRIERALVSLAYEMNPTGLRFQMALPYAGVTVIPVGVRTTICPTEKLLDIILRLAPQMIFGRPFEILRYGDALKMRGIDPADTKIIKLFYLGEIVSQGKWKRMQQLWDDAEVYGHYGLTEIDAGLQTCRCGNYHEPSSPYLLTELIEPTGDNPVLDGEWGEVVFTSLRHGHAPLLRYRTGDLAQRLLRPCLCGQEGPAYVIRGRLSDAYCCGNTTVFPVEVENIVFEHGDIGNEYLFFIEPDGKLHLSLERSFESDLNLNILAKRVAESLRENLGVCAKIDVAPFGGLADKLGIPKKKSGRFTDLRNLTPKERKREVEINVVDSYRLRVNDKDVLSI